MNLDADTINIKDNIATTSYALVLTKNGMLNKHAIACNIVP